MHRIRRNVTRPPRSLPDVNWAVPQFLHGMEPVFLRRSLRTASGLPERISQRRDVLVPKDREAVFVYSGPVRFLGMLVSLLGVLQSLPGALLPGLMILFLMGFRSTTVSVGGTIVQLSGPLMILVMRSVVIASRH